MKGDAANGDAGMTLIELIVYSMLAMLVLSVVGGLLINSLSTQKVVADSAASSNSGVLVSQSVSAGVRNSIDIRAVPGDPAILIAHILDDALAVTPVTHCEAWYFEAGDVRTTRYAASTGTAPTDDSGVAGWLEAKAGPYAGWTLLGSGVVAAEDASGTPRPVLTAVSSNQVELVLEVSTGNGASVLVDTSAVSRQHTPTGVTKRCF